MARAAVPDLAHYRSHEVIAMMYGWDAAGTGGWMMVAAMAIIAAAIVVSVWLIVHRPGTQVSANRTPMDILSERFARGEITREQFEDAKRALG
jgi:putative membrane protein